MISLKRFLETQKNDAASALMRAALLLLEAIALHAVRIEASESAAFSASIRLMRRQIEEASDGDRVLVLCGEAIHALESYNRDVENGIRIRTTEFQEMIRMLARTIVEVSAAGASATSNLQQIEKQFQDASRLSDLHLIKVQLGEALKALATETARQREQADRISRALKDRLESASLVGGNDIDPVTGLPGVTAAEEALEALFRSPSPGYAALFRVARIELINSRFGFGAGDRVLVILSQHIAQQLSPADRLFRWRGPTLLALLQRSAKLQDIRLEVNRIASARLEHVIEIRNRSVLLPISSTSLTLPLAETGSAGKAIDALNSFSEWEAQPAARA